jgi:hypothetical protein
MEMDKRLIPPCGLYCGVCGILIAHRDNNMKFKERLSTVYHVPPDEIKCEGCLSDVVFKYCVVCPIKTCAKEKGYEGCFQCADFPCKHVDNFPMPVGKKVILRAIPQWKEMGTEKWVQAEIERYHCPQCGNSLFRGAKRCNKCGIAVDVD